MRFSEYLNQVNVKHKTISFNLLTSNNKGEDHSSLVQPKIKLNAKQTFDLLAPYCASRVVEQLKAVVPLAAYLMIFQILVLRQPVEEAFILFCGLAAVIVVLQFYGGISTGLMPFGTIIGDNLPKKLL